MDLLEGRAQPGVLAQAPLGQIEVRERGAGREVCEEWIRHR